MRKSASAGTRVDGIGVDMTPMLDIVFILLIFFIVTTSFIKETAVPVHGLAQPERTDVDPVQAIAVRIEDGNVIRLEDRVIDIGAVAAHIERLRAADPGRPVIVLTGLASDAGTLVAVIDAVRSTGVDSVPVARLEAR